MVVVVAAVAVVAVDQACVVVFCAPTWAGRTDWRRQWTPHWPSGVCCWTTVWTIWTIEWKTALCLVLPFKRGKEKGRGGCLNQNTKVRDPPRN